MEIEPVNCINLDVSNIPWLFVKPVLQISNSSTVNAKWMAAPVMDLLAVSHARHQLTR
jgi:hypothetical protein